MKPLLRWSIRGWLVSMVVIAGVAAGFLVVLLAPAVNAAPEEKVSLDCLSCHTRVLKGHNKLGEGSKACWVCHDRITMGELRLLDGTQLPLTGSPRVCGQCHTKNYQDWNEGKHGILPLGADGAGLLVTSKGKCIVCHDPHQPQMELSAKDTSLLPTVSSKTGVLNCLSCHARVLKGHDKLGSGSEACRVCHSSTQMGVLHLAGGETLLPMAESPKLCAQCHQSRYQEWAKGTHGMPSWEDGIAEIHGVRQVSCISCHNPHQPQIALLGITKPHPAPVPSPPPPPLEPLLMLGSALLLTIGIGVVVATRGEGL